MNTHSLHHPNRPPHDCTQSPCCLAQLSLDEVREGIWLSIIGAREAAESNDLDGVDWFDDWHRRFAEELERRGQDDAR
jgi:hypothetical protein